MSEESAIGESQDVDAEELRRELDQIKTALGIQDQYSGATTAWLVLGVLVLGCATLSQVVQLEELPQSYHMGIWVGVFGGGYALWAMLQGAGAEQTWRAGDARPNPLLQFGLVYLAIVPLQSIVFAYVRDLGYHEETALALALIVVLLGVAYGVIGNSLAAYRIRFRDRLVFYVGTVWMIALGMAIPAFEALETWGYAAFGVAYFGYALATYLYLTRVSPGLDGDDA